MYDSINTLEKIITSYENNTIIFRQGDSKTIETYPDDKHNKLIKREVFYNDKLMNINQYQYDSLGNVVSWETSHVENNINSKFHYKYEFDHKGNWIKRIKYQASLTDNELTPKEITNRKITYYPERSNSDIITNLIIGQLIGIIILFIQEYKSKKKRAVK